MPRTNQLQKPDLQTEFQELWDDDNDRVLYDSARFGVMVVASNRPRLMAHAVILPRLKAAANFKNFYAAPTLMRIYIHTLTDHVALKMLKSATSEQRALTYIGGFSESKHIHAHVYLAKESQRTQLFDGESLGEAGIKFTTQITRFNFEEVQKLEQELESITIF